MKSLFTLLLISVIASVVLPAVPATSTSFHIEISPLECSFDTVALGQTTSQQIIPKDCQQFSARLDEFIAPTSGKIPGRHFSPSQATMPAFDRIEPDSKNNPHASGKDTCQAKEPPLLYIYSLVAIFLVLVIDFFLLNPKSSKTDA